MVLRRVAHVQQNSARPELDLRQQGGLAETDGEQREQQHARFVQSVCAQSAPPFAAGMVDGYFNKNPPSEFWKCLAFYIASNTLSSVYWAMDYGQGEMDVMLRQTQDVISWYDGFDTVIPSWYITAHRLINI